MGRLHSKSYHQVNYHYPELEVRPRLLVAVDTAPDRVRFAIDELGYLEGTDDWRSVIAHPEVETVNITAPNYVHREIAILAAEQGKHFWIEKPVGRNVDETEDIDRAARAAGVITAVGFNYRHAPAVQHARELVRSGGIGRVVHMRGVFLNDFAAEPKGALSWRFQRTLGGLGVVGDLMSHTIDLLQHLVGPIAETSALTKIVIPERPMLPMGVGDHFAVVEGGKMGTVENEDYAGALLRFGDGAVGTWEVSRVTVGPRCQIALTSLAPTVRFPGTSRG